MFYAHIILAKKGPLARVWLAAHWDKKITKAHVFETNIEKSVEGIMQPKVKLALRTSGHLLLGVVRIYSRKAKYLLADCNEAFVKIKMAFRPGMVDLPEGHREANVNAITLPEVFHDFDTALPELNDIDIEAQFSVNQSRADEITMREDYGSLSLSLHDDGFGDIGFESDTPDLVRASIDTNINDQLFEDDGGANTTLITSHNSKLPDTDATNTRLEVDGFGDEFGQPQLFEDDLFGEPSTTSDPAKVPLIPTTEDFEEFEARVDYDNHPASPVSSCQDFHTNIDNADANENPDAVDKIGENVENDKNPVDQATLLQNEDESFALAPVDASAYKGVTKSKRKRKLIVDEIKNISGEEMKAQLANTSDIVTTLDLAPPTKRLMYWKETGGVEKLFSLPSRNIPASVLFVNYSRHLISRFTQLEDFTCLDPNDLLALDHIQNENECPSIIPIKRGRKRKVDILPLVQVQNEITGDITTQSLAGPEPMREQDISRTVESPHLTIGIHSQDSLIQSTDTSNIFDAIRSPGPIFSINEINEIGNLSSLNDIPLTPGNMNCGIDTSDDFNQGDMTPAELHHGHMTPHHSGIESIESIPNLPSDQISSILNEAENMCKVGDNSISADWNEYDNFPAMQGIQSTSEEQLENETDEQFEERVLNKRAAQLFYAVKSRMLKQECLLLSELTVRNSRKQSTSEEQLENETDEQFEERVLNKRAAQLFYAVKSRMLKQECLLLSEFTVRNSRKQAAQKFYSLLVLKKFRALNVIQSAPYSDIRISRGPLFENPKL